MKKISVKVIERSRIIAEILDESFIQIKVCSGETGSMISALKAGPDVVIVAYHVYGQKTREYIAEIMRVFPESKIVVIGDNLDEKDVLELYMAGAKGYLTFANSQQFINKCIKVVIRNEAWISRKMARILIEKLRDLRTPFLWRTP